MRVDEPITVYSPFSAEEDRTPEQAEATYYQCHAANRWDRDTYLALPWAMQDLVGTTWRNVHTGSLATISPLQTDRWEHPQISTMSERAFGQLIWPLGLWLHKRYVIDHWVRVDHLSLNEQLVWFGFRTGWLKEEIASYERRFLNDRSSSRQKARREEQSHHEQELLYDERQMHLFAYQHHLSIPPEILDYKVEPFEQRWERIALLHRKQRSS